MSDIQPDPMNVKLFTSPYDFLSDLHALLFHALRTSSVFHVVLLF